MYQTWSKNGLYLLHHQGVFSSLPFVQDFRSPPEMGKSMGITSSISCFVSYERRWKRERVIMVKSKKNQKTEPSWRKQHSLRHFLVGVSFRQNFLRVLFGFNHLCVPRHMYVIYEHSQWMIYLPTLGVVEWVDIEYVWLFCLLGGLLNLFFLSPLGKMIQVWRAHIF